MQQHAEWEPILREPDTSIRRRKLEAWLDRGCGECWLRQSPIAQKVEQSLLQSHETEYCLRAWVIMPNHLHIVVDVWEVPLSRLLQKWKGSTARQANKLLQRRGTFWQQDYFDTLIRNEEHLRRAISYTESNPARIRLVLDARQWQWSSARRRDVYGRL